MKMIADIIMKMLTRYHLDSSQGTILRLSYNYRNIKVYTTIIVNFVFGGRNSLENQNIMLQNMLAQNI